MITLLLIPELLTFPHPDNSWRMIKIIICWSINLLKWPVSEMSHSWWIAQNSNISFLPVILTKLGESRYVSWTTSPAVQYEFHYIWWDGLRELEWSFSTKLYHGFFLRQLNINFNLKVVHPLSPPHSCLGINSFLWDYKAQ